MRRLGLLLILLLASAVLLRLSQAHIVDWARRRAEQTLAAVFHGPARIGAVDLRWLPLRLHVSDVNIGGEARALTIGEATLIVRPLASLRHARVEATLAARSVFFDVDRLPKTPPGAAKQPTEPSAPITFEITATQLTDIAVQFSIDHEPVTATAALATGRVGMSGSRPYVTFSVHAPAAALQRAARRLTVEAVDLDAGVVHDQFFVDKWTIRGERIFVEATGDALPPAARHHIVADVPFEALAVIFEPLGVVSGTLHVDGTCQGELFDPVAEADVQLAHATVQNLSVGAVHGTLTRRGRELSIAAAEITAWGGSATASFAMTVGGAVPATGHITWRDLDAALIGHVDSRSSHWSVLSQGQADLSGSLNPVSLTLQGAGTLEPSQSHPMLTAADAGPMAFKPAQWSAELTVHAHELGLTGTVEQGTVNRVRMALTLASGDMLSGSADATLDDVALLAPLTPPPLRDGLSGGVSANATVRGPLGRPTFAGTVTADRLTVLGATVPKLRGEFEWTGNELTARAVHIATVTGSGEIDGVVALNQDATNDWRVTARGMDFGPFSAAADYLGWTVAIQGGTLDGTVTCRGRWAAPDLDADLDLQRFWLLGEPMHDLVLRGHASPDTWDGEVLLTHTDGESFRARASGQGTHQLQATIESTPWQLASLRGAGTRGLDGSVTLHATLEGSLAQLGGSVRIDGHALAAGDHGFGDAVVTAQGNGGNWVAEVVALGDALRLHATWHIGNQWPFTLNGELASTDVAALLLLKSLLHVDAAGSVAIHGQLASLDDVGGELRIESLRVARQSYAMQASEPVVVRGEHGRFELVHCTLAGAGTELRMGGSLATTGVIDLALNGSGDLQVVELLLGPVQSARGDFTLAAQIQHNRDGLWHLQGTANVSDGDVDVGLPIALSSTDAALSLAGGRVIIEDLAGKLGGGSFRIGGALDVNSGPEIWWSAQQVAVPLSDGFEARVSGQGKITGTWDKPSIAGDVEVLNALYDRNVELTDLLPWLRNYLLPSVRREGAPTRPVALVLRIYAHDGVYIDNNVAKVEMWLNLQVTGTSVQPVVAGTIGFLSGEVIYQDRTFIISGGSIDFRDALEINPLLNITAESQVTTVEAEYTVRVVVSGTADNPRVQFSADDPSLSQNDVLSLVAFGRTAAQLQREGGKFTPGSALTLVPTGPVEQQLRQFAGIDRFEIDAAQTPNTGTIEPRITVGKDLTEQIRALASSSFGVESRRSVQLEYRVTTRFSLIGSWESDAQSGAGAFGGGVKFRYEFRRVPISLFGLRQPPTVHADAR